jgi:predicted O-methyltransferase YrrM
LNNCRFARSVEGMVAYNLSHLTQNEDQATGGPIQDDEALFLYGLIRVMRLKRVLEIGGLNGYSAKNFCEAVGDGGVVFTVDVEPLTPVSERHVTLCKDARNLSPADVGNSPLDLIFFDCHDYDVQWRVYRNLRRARLVTDDTVLAFHDTNLHPVQIVPYAYRVQGGWVHQDTERRMVNKFKRIGFDVFALNTSMMAHDQRLPFRHGLTVVTKFKRFDLRPADSLIYDLFHYTYGLIRRARRMAIQIIAEKP